ncbi:MAG: TolC family protein [Ignavibacteria bacterium]|nr:TolC family protein [Ignavibacteria bacterium]
MHSKTIPTTLRLIAILLLGLSGGARAQAPEPLTLAQCVREARAANPKLASLRAKTEGARARVKIATAWDDPLFAFEFYNTPITSINPLMDGLENDYSLQQMIPFPGKKALMGEMESLTAKMTAEDAVAYERALIAEVKSGWAMLVSAERRLAISRENQELLAQIVESARSRVAVGLAGQSVLLRLGVELDKAKNEEAGLRRERRSAEAMLNALRGAPATAPIAVAAETPASAPLAPLDDLVARALETRAEIRGMGFEGEMYRTEQRMWSREKLPDFMVRGMYKQMMGEMADSWALMVGITIPIAPWASGKYDGRIEEAEARERAAGAAQRDMRAMTGAQVRDAWERVTSLREQRARYRDGMLPQSAQALASVLTEFRTGKADFIGMLDGFRMHAMLRMEEAMLEADEAAAVAALERAVGGDLDGGQ